MATAARRGALRGAGRAGAPAVRRTDRRAAERGRGGAERVHRRVPGGVHSGLERVGRGSSPPPLEFPSVAHVWLAQRPRGAEVVPVRDERYEDVVDGRTALVSVPLITYQDARAAAGRRGRAAAHDVGAPRCSSTPTRRSACVPVDVGRAGLRLPGRRHAEVPARPAGAGVPVRARRQSRRPAPQLTGWFGRVDPFAFDPRDAGLPGDARAVRDRHAGGAGGLRRERRAAADRRARPGRGAGARARAAAGRRTPDGAGRTAAGAARDRRGAHIGLLDADPPGSRKPGRAGHRGQPARAGSPALVPLPHRRG